MEADFSPEYFLDEVRDGFYVPSILKRTWAEHIAVLAQIDEACQQLNIKWFAAWGTLLGAIRHGGFIPWDDDIDIFMFRNDFNRFRDYAADVLPTEYQVKSIWNDRDMYSDILRINNTKGEELNGEYLEKHNGCFYGCGVDIFPIDVIDASIDTEVLREKLRLITHIKSADLDGLKDYKRQRISEARKLGLDIDIKHSSANECMKIWVDLLEKAAPEYSGHEDLIEKNRLGQISASAVLANGWSFSGDTYQIEWFSSTIMAPFENTQIQIPEGWEEVLHTHFGDYNQIVRGGSNHVFPFFTPSQKKLWKAAPELKYIPRAEEIRDKAVIGSVDELDGVCEPEPGCIVFLPVSISDWNYMGPVYEHYSNRSEYNCVVILIPYMLRKNDRGFMEMNWEAEEFDKAGIPVTRYDKYDFGKPRPKAIVMSDPYDSYNGGYSVHPFFYSTNLRQFTDTLIYVQCFEVDLSQLDSCIEWTCEYFIKQPGIAAADVLVLTDKTTVEGYCAVIEEWKKEL